MKNIHILPTLKLSRLHYYYYFDGQPVYGLSPTNLSWRNGRHLYITSDENKKLKDYVYDVQTHNIFRIDNYSELESAQNEQYKKIILTTDLELIVEGVQAIDDKFLQWFIKNHECEFIKIDNIRDRVYVDDHLITSTHIKYEISIPQEKPTKKEMEKKWDSLIDAGLDEPFKCWDEQVPKTEIDWSNFPQSTKDAVGYVEPNKLKQETLEEAAERYLETSYYMILPPIDYIKFGAKWQAEQLFKDDAIKTLENGMAFLLKKVEKMYNEEDMLEFHTWAYQKNRTEESDKTTKQLLIEWKQFKKK